MKIGFLNIVPWKGHDSHVKFLMECAKRNNHTVHYISCGGGRKHCYQKLVNHRPFECLHCIIKNRVTAFSSNHHVTYKIKAQHLVGGVACTKFSASVISSVGSSLRKERDDWIDSTNDNELDLLQSTERDYNNLTAEFVRGMSEQKYDFLFIFNGRFHDVAAAIKAAQKLNIPFATHERAWFGRGLQINLNSDCLSLKYGHHDKNVNYSDQDLKNAKDLIERRINNGIIGEWKVYNQSRSSLDAQFVPANYKGKYLVIPSSRSEFLGHSDFKLSDENSLVTLDKFLEFYNINAQEVIVRGHPAWTSKIGHKELSESAQEYRSWCVDNGATFIESDDSSVSTYELMLVSKLGIFNGGSAVIEAVHLRLPCVALSKAHYISGSFVTDLSVAKGSWPATLPREVKESDLFDLYKYVHFRYRHQVTFFNHVFANSSTKYSYNIDQSCLREFESIVSMGKMGMLSDAAYSVDREKNVYYSK
jgi:hypothetical protein